MFAPYQFLIAMENDRLRTAAGGRPLAVGERADLLAQETGVVVRPPRRGLGRHVRRAFSHRAAADANA
jgi:hypothetical protein